MKLARVVLIVILSLTLSSVFADESPKNSERPRVFITDSQSWEVSGGGGGTSGGIGGGSSGGARPQTAEIIKTFGERCPQVVTNNIQAKSDYVVVLDHEGGKGPFFHRNKVAVFARISGDSIVSKSTYSLGASVQEACQAISKDWEAHADAIRAAASVATQQNAAIQAVADTSTVTLAGSRFLVASTPDDADIEVDGSFVGNTPSEISLAEGEHTILVRKAGFKTWDKKLKVTNGSNIRLNARLEKKGD